MQLTGLTADDLGSHLVTRNPGRTSQVEAVFDGQSEVLRGLTDLGFTRLPVGRYLVELLREDPFSSAAQPYRRVGIPKGY